MKSKKLNIDIYGDKALFFWGKNPNEYFKKRFKGYTEVDDKHGCKGCHFVLDDNTDGIAKRVIWVEDKERVDIIVHELTHLVYWLCEWKCIKEDEAQAYLMQYLFSQAIS